MWPSGAARSAAPVAEELVRLLVGLYGDGLGRIVAALRADGAPGAAMLDRLTDDPLVESLLLLHDLHPLDVDARIQRALDRVRPYLGSHAGGVQYLGVRDGVARLRLEGNCHGCPSSTVTVQLALQGAVQDAAPEVTFEWRIPRDAVGRPLSNAIERDRARTYFQAYAAACALYFTEQALAEIRAGRTKTWEPFKVPDEANSCGFTEAVRGVLSHHMVIRGGKIANYHPYPPTPWNASVRDSFGTPGPYEDAVQNTPIFEENPPESFKGIDIMRAVRSFDPCLPCGVHMYLGNGKMLEKVHSPMTVTLST